jgi:hypothetical protein
MKEKPPKVKPKGWGGNAIKVTLQIYNIGNEEKLN